jgi:arylsulfatase A-like enzyme
MALGALMACTSETEESTGAPPIILVSLDTVRADALGAYGSSAALTPSLDRFAREAVLFEQAYAQSTETLFSHASLFTSRYPSELGPVDYTFSFPDGTHTLASILGVHGYQTAAFVAGGHMSPVFGLGVGFETYQSDREWGSLQQTVPPALEWVAARDATQPFLMLVHGYDAHHRYLKPSPWGYLFSDPDQRGTVFDLTRKPSGTTRLVDGYYFADQSFDEIFYWREIRMRSPEAIAAIAREGDARGVERLGSSDIEFIRGLYSGAVSYADGWFGELMLGLEEQELLDEAIIVVFSDHGEELGEEGLFNHRLSLDERLLHVPLMIRLPGAENGGMRVSERVALLDILPTLLDAASVAPLAEARGQSLWGIQSGEPVSGHDYVYAESPARAIAAHGPAGTLEFTGMAPHSPFLVSMLESAALEGPAFESSFTGTPRSHARDALLSWRRSLPASPDSAGALDAERRRVLQESGYWGGQP